VSRDLEWDGCFNVRDLGGIPIVGGRSTRWGAFVRADSLNKLTADGWAALIYHGVRTVVDMRNPDERFADIAPRPSELTTVHQPLDGIENRDFWGQGKHGRQFGTPLYYASHLQRLPDRSAAVLRAIAAAGQGGIVFHCVGGRDRTGQVTILLLALAGVSTDEIVADYEHSDVRLVPLWEGLGIPHQGHLNERFLAERDTSAAALITSVLDTIDVEATLRRGGLTDVELAALRARLTGQ
jgi:hypothetical protein